MLTRVIGFVRLAGDQFLLMERAQAIIIKDEGQSLQTRVDILLVPKNELDILLKHLIDEGGFIYEGNIELVIEGGNTYKLVAYAAQGTDMPTQIRLGEQAKDKMRQMRVDASSRVESLQWNAPEVWGLDESVVWEVRHSN